MKKFFISLLLCALAQFSFAWNSETEIINYYTSKINALKNEYEDCKIKDSQTGASEKDGNFLEDNAASHIKYNLRLQQIPDEIKDLEAMMNDEINKFRSSQQSTQPQGESRKKGNSSSNHSRSTGTTVRGAEQRAQEINNYYDNLRKKAKERKRQKARENAQDYREGSERHKSAMSGYYHNKAERDNYMATEGIRYLESFSASDNISIPNNATTASTVNTMSGSDMAKMLTGARQSSKEMVPIAEKSSLDKSREEALIVLGDGDYENVEKREFEGDVAYEGYVQQSPSMIGSLWNKFDSFMSSTYEDGEYGGRIAKEYVFFLSELRSCYQDVRDFSVDVWERYEIPNRVTNIFQSIKNGAVNFVDNPLEVAQNVGDKAKENILGYVKDNAFKPVIKLAPNSSGALENSSEAYEFMSDLANNTADLVFNPGKVVDAIGNSEKTKEWNNEYNQFQKNTVKKASAMFGNVAERDGMVKFHHVLESAYDLSDDKEESGPYSKEQVKEEAKKHVQKEVKKQVQKEAKKQAKARTTEAFKKMLPEDLVKNLDFYIDK